MFPNEAQLVAIMLVATLNRKGLVADCIFPQVKTPCNFKYIDWSNDINGARIIDATVGCKTDVHEVDSEPFILKTDSVVPQALQQSLGECCAQVCGQSDTEAQNLITLGKTRQLMNKLLVAREKKAIDIATDTGSYTNGGSTAPEAYSSGTDGVKFDLAKSDVSNANFKLLSWFLGINANRRVSGPRNVMVTDQATLNKLLTHPDFIGRGCNADPITTQQAIASLLGLSKICIADSMYNDGIGDTPSIVKLWPADTILFTSSYEFVTSEDETLAFGISAYDQGFFQFQYKKEEKGPKDGVVMQKISHDFTPVVLSFKAATLIKLT